MLNGTLDIFNKDFGVTASLNAHGVIELPGQFEGLALTLESRLKEAGFIFQRFPGQHNDTIHFHPLNKFTCALCGAERDNAGSAITTGYATVTKAESLTECNGNALAVPVGKVCFKCMERVDKAKMHTEGKHVLYVTHPNFNGGSQTQGTVTNWPGTLRFSAHCQRARRRNAFGAERVDVWFYFNGFQWHGVNLGDSQIVRCKRTKTKAG